MPRNELDSKLSYVQWFLCGLQRGIIRRASHFLSKSFPYLEYLSTRSKCICLAEEERKWEASIGFF